MKTIVSLISYLFILFFTSATQAYTVKNLKATYSNGQVFLTWTTPDATNLKYNIYRSTEKFISSSQLNSSTLIGNVRDSSCKNIRLTQILEAQKFLKISNSGTPLAANQGVYVVTCNDNQSYYYCVTVTKLSNNIEAKKLKDGKNNLNTAVTEIVAAPQPVLQDTTIWGGTETVYYYVWFGNNKDVPGFPAMCSQGSYAFNFYLIKRGSATKYPVFAFYEGLKQNSLKGNGIDSFSKVTGCYILGFDDWIPTPDGNSIGRNTFWSGYHEDYDFYRSDNPIPTSGTIKMFSQRQYIQSILWVRNFADADSNKVYLVGVSSGGMGAYLTANLIPDKVSASYCVAGNFKLVPIANSDTQPEQMWGELSSNLNSDILNPQTDSFIKVFDLFDIRKMFFINKNRNMPLIFSVFGKNDPVILWSTYTVSLADSMQRNKIGGIFYWDQRVHDGSGKNFNDAETMPDWYSYNNKLSFPAFSNCTVNQDIGNGTPTNGAPYGSINGYISWTKDNVTDETCKITYRTKVITMYVGGVADPVQFNTCFADVTVRRAQNFNPSVGATIKWNNFDSSNVKIQNGSFVYNGGLITIPGVQFNKSGTRLDIKISNCNKEEDEEELEMTNAVLPELIVHPVPNGISILINLLPDEPVSLRVFNIMGESVLNKTIPASFSEFQIPLIQMAPGMYIISLKGAAFSLSKKILVNR